MKLLLIEDNPAMQTTLARSFAKSGAQVVVCDDGARALERWQATQPDVVLLDLTLPGVDGLQVLSQARAQGLATPVLILTARGAVGDRILGLKTGADDYLPKPFDLDELEARVQALARRHGVRVNPREAGSFGGLRADPDSAAIYFRKQPLDLTLRESALLGALLARPGHAVAKERLQAIVFKDDPNVQTDAVEVVAYRLRKKLAAVAELRVELVTLRGLGYLVRETPVLA
jgi:two-component system, OmpR family, response regulator TctD